MGVPLSFPHARGAYADVSGLALLMSNESLLCQALNLLAVSGHHTDPRID